MKKFNSDEWDRKVDKDGRVYYDRKDINRPLPTTEEFLVETFSEQYVFKKASKFKKVEKEFLDTLSPEQKEKYAQVLEMLREYRRERELKLVSYARNWGRITFD